MLKFDKSHFYAVIVVKRLSPETRGYYIDTKNIYLGAFSKYTDVEQAFKVFNPKAHTSKLEIVINSRSAGESEVIPDWKVALLNLFRFLTGKTLTHLEGFKGV